jgi:hypothetical protein
MRTLAAFAACLCAAAALAQENVYRNATAPSAPLAAYAAGAEFGDQVTLGGAGRTLATFTFGYFGDIPLQGDERVTLTLYRNDGSGGAPSSVIFQSTPMPVDKGYYLKTVVLPLPTVPDTLTWAITPSGVSGTPGDRIQAVCFNTPTIGSSGNFVWTRTGATWTQQTVAGTSSNLLATTWAGSEPAYPYSNLQVDSGQYLPLLQEFGDVLDLEGTRRELTRLSFGFYCPALIADGEAEDLIVRLYSIDPATGQPGTLLWTSAPVPVAADPQQDQFVDLDIPNLMVEDRLAWTVQFRGVTQDHPVDSAGLIIYPGPTIGSSRDNYVAKDVPGNPGWQQYAFGGSPLANFYARLEGVADIRVFPTSYAIVFGTHASGNLQSLFVQDNSSLIVDQTPPVDLLSPSVRVRVVATSPAASPTAFSFRAALSTGAVPATSITQWIRLYNYQTNLFELVDTRAATAGDNVIVVTPGGSISRFVKPGTLEVMADFSWFDPGTLFVPAWAARMNEAVWMIE